MKKYLIIACLFALGTLANAQTIKPYGPIPTATQLQWADQEFYLFVHFGPNTFTNKEWGAGTEHESAFNPTALDCRQWCRIAKAAGAKGLIITAKHHDGFCLWPSAYSTHTVKQSTWRNGKGDVLKELRAACTEYNIGMGVYLSPWDRNHPKYGTAAYNDVYVNMMKEVCANYGPFFEFWWDGANGEGPNGKKQVYDWKRFIQTLRTAAPNTPIFSDIGPDIRWEGNEEAHGGDPNWNTLDTAGKKPGAGAPPEDTLNHGNIYGSAWIPEECNTSIRPGWFYHATQDDTVKTPEMLFNLYLKSVGRGGNFLLNVPPNRKGLFAPQDSAALIGFKKLLDDNFKTSLIQPKKALVSMAHVTGNIGALVDKNYKTFVSLGNDYKNNYIEIRFTQPTAVDCIVLQEPIQMGQRVKHFTIETLNDDGTTFSLDENTIGHKRIVTFPKQMATKIRIYVTDAKALPLIGEVNAYMIDESLIEKP